MSENKKKETDMLSPEEMLRDLDRLNEDMDSLFGDEPEDAAPAPSVDDPLPDALPVPGADAELEAGPGTDPEIPEVETKTAEPDNLPDDLPDDLMLDDLPDFGMDEGGDVNYETASDSEKAPEPAPDTEFDPGDTNPLPDLDAPASASSAQNPPEEERKPDAPKAKAPDAPAFQRPDAPRPAAPEPRRVPEPERVPVPPAKPAAAPDRKTAAKAPVPAETKTDAPVPSEETADTESKPEKPGRKLSRKEMRQMKKAKEKAGKAARTKKTPAPAPAPKAVPAARTGKTAAGKSGSRKTKANNGTIIPRTVQESIPYVSTYSDGIIEIERGVYTKSYRIPDVSFDQASQNEQIRIFDSYCEMLNQLDPSVRMEITTYNRSIDMEQFANDVLLKPQDDALNAYRDDYNRMLLEKSKEAQNNIRREKYLTLTIEANGRKDADRTFQALDSTIASSINKTTKGVDTQPMTIDERLSLLYSIYNQDSKSPFLKHVQTFDGYEADLFSLKNCQKYGITTKDCIGPDSMSFERTKFMIGNRYGRTLFIAMLPSQLKMNILTELSSLPTNMLVSVHYRSMQQAKAVKLIKKYSLNINSEIIQRQSKAFQKGYNPTLANGSLSDATEAVNDLMDQVQKQDQKLFFATVVVTIFAKSKEDLEKYTTEVQAIAQKNICRLDVLGWQQEYGFDTSLPLGYNRIYAERMLTTASAAVFLPYSSQEITQPHGMYYGLNANSKSMILLNRLRLKNANGVILGTPGSGKSFSAKREMLNVILNTDDDVFVIDPEREYKTLAEALGGSVIRVAPGSGVYINPMDMDLHYADDDTGGKQDPIQMKSDYIASLCETALGGRIGLTPGQMTIIDRCARRLYEDYVRQLDELNMGKDEDKQISFDADLCPTLTDFYNELRSQYEPEAKNIALALERYTIGSLDSFAKKTNVQTNSRFTVYDTKDIGSGMMEMGVRVCLNDVWNKMIANRRKNKRTWIYIDEFYLLTQSDSSARFLQMIWKRARKWGGGPTGITQNVTDLLERKEAMAILSDSDFVMMLNQAPIDRDKLSAMLNISESLQNNITNATAGHGLIYAGSTIVPFVDDFPKDSLLFPLLSSTVGETADDAQNSKDLASNVTDLLQNDPEFRRFALGYVRRAQARKTQEEE